MYVAKMTTQVGIKQHTVVFDCEHGLLCDIDPLNSAETEISTARGVNQVGDSVQSTSAGGIYRTVSGVILSREAGENLLKALPVFATGTLVLNDTYQCDFVVKKTPYTFRSKNGKTSFNLQIFCPLPYWKGMEKKTVVLGGWNPLFSFPTVYDHHEYAEATADAQTNAVNNGDYDSDMTLTFTTSMLPVEAFGLRNDGTGEYVQINAVMYPGERFVLSRANGILKVRKFVGNLGTDAFGAFDIDSNLFPLHSGDNVLRQYNASGVSSGFSATIEYQDTYSGVWPYDL